MVMILVVVVVAMLNYDVGVFVTKLLQIVAEVVGSSLGGAWVKGNTRIREQEERERKKEEEEEQRDIFSTLIKR